MVKISWKASVIDHLTDARFFNSLEDAWLEFNFDVLQDRSVSIDTCKSIIEWLYEPQLLAAFGMHQNSEEIEHILTQTQIQYASIPFGHDLTRDKDFSSICFLKINTTQLPDALSLENAPYAYIIRAENQLSEEQINNIVLLNTKSKIFIQSENPIEFLQLYKSYFHHIGIEIPTSPENSPETSAVEIYDEIIFTLTQEK